MGSRDVQIVAGVVVHKQYTVVDDAGIYPRKATKWVPKEAYGQKIFQTKCTDANRDINKNIPMNLSTLNWGDKSRSFTWGRIICTKKEQNVEEKIYVFSYFERTQQSEME